MTRVEFNLPTECNDGIKNKHMRALNLINPTWAISEIDVLIDLPIFPDEACVFGLNGIIVPTFSLAHLISITL